MPQDLLVQNHCGQCGSNEHGAPLLRYNTGAAGGSISDIAGVDAIPAVSLSRSENMVAVALYDGGAVGIDLESIDRFGSPDFDAVLLHPAERDALAALDESEHPTQRAKLWTAKESILKLSGHGLTIDPERLWCTLSGTQITLKEWPAELGFPYAPEVSVHEVLEDFVYAVATMPVNGTDTPTPRTFSYWEDSWQKSSPGAS